MILLFFIVLFFVSYVVFSSNKKKKSEQDKSIFYLCCILVLSSFMVYFIKRDQIALDFSLGAYFALTIGPILFFLIKGQKMRWIGHLIPLVTFSVLYLFVIACLPRFYADYGIYIDEVLFGVVTLSCIAYGSYGYLYVIKSELDFKKNSVLITYIVLTFSCAFFFAILIFQSEDIFDIDYIYMLYCFTLILVAFIDTFRGYLIKAKKEKLVGSLLVEENREEEQSTPIRIEVETIRNKDLEDDDLVESREWMLTKEKEKQMMVIRQKLFEHLIESKLYLETDLTLLQLSDIMGVDRKELSEYFKESNSVSFRQYINRLKVEYAVSLIKEKNKDVTVEELTSFCGFNTRLSFYRAFVHVYGFPPSALLSK